MRWFISLCLFLNAGCATMPPGSIEEQDLKVYEKNDKKLEKLCNKKKNRKKAICLLYENNIIEEESHNHTPLWFWIFMPYVVGVVIAFLSQQ